MRDQVEKLRWDFTFSQHTEVSVCDKRTVTSHISVLRHPLCFYNGPTTRFDLIVSDPFDEVLFDDVHYFNLGG